MSSRRPLRFVSHSERRRPTHDGRPATAHPMRRSLASPQRIRTPTSTVLLMKRHYPENRTRSDDFSRTADLRGGAEDEWSAHNRRFAHRHRRSYSVRATHDNDGAPRQARPRRFISLSSIEPSSPAMPELRRSIAGGLSTLAAVPSPIFGTGSFMPRNGEHRGKRTRPAIPTVAPATLSINRSAWALWFDREAPQAGRPPPSAPPSRRHDLRHLNRLPSGVTVGSRPMRRLPLT